MDATAAIAADLARRRLGEGGPDQSSVPALWDTARYLMRWLIAVCGDPCALVAKPWLSRKERRGIVFWLRPVEAIVRRLLVAEAARIARRGEAMASLWRSRAKTPPPAPKAAPRKERPRFCRVAFPDPENSTGWAVRFCVVPAAARPGFGQDRGLPRLRTCRDDADVLAPALLARAAALDRQRRADSCQHTEERRPKACRAAGSPWRLARRIEAVLRVLENPAPYARRLARRLRKHAARLARICHPPPPPEPGERPPLGHQPLRHAGDHALRALSEVRSQ